VCVDFLIFLPIPLHLSLSLFPSLLDTLPCHALSSLSLILPFFIAVSPHPSTHPSQSPLLVIPPHHSLSLSLLRPSLPLSPPPSHPSFTTSYQRSQSSDLDDYTVDYSGQFSRSRKQVLRSIICYLTVAVDCVFSYT
jgi:hypothetical protein